MFIFLKLVLGLDNYKQVIHPDGYLVGNFKAAWNILTIFHIVGYLVPGPLPTKYQHSSQPSPPLHPCRIYIYIRNHKIFAYRIVLPSLRTIAVDKEL